MYLYEFWKIFEEVVSINCDSFGLAFCDNEVVLNASRTANGRRDGGGGEETDRRERAGQQGDKEKGGRGEKAQQRKEGGKNR